MSSFRGKVFREYATGMGCVAVERVKCSSPDEAGPLIELAWTCPGSIPGRALTLRWEREMKRTEHIDSIALVAWLRDAAELDLMDDDTFERLYRRVYLRHDVMTGKVPVGVVRCS